MNRIKLGMLASSEYPQVDPWTNHRQNESSILELVAPPPLAIEHSVFLPAHFEAKYQYPLVIWLHAPCADHDQLAEVMPGISDRNFIGLSIRGTQPVGGGYQWKQTTETIESVTNQLLQMIDCLTSRYRINTDQIFVAGAGCGGTMAYRLAFHLPKLFCGVGSFNGGMPENLIPLVNLRACRCVPVFWVHGRESSDLTEPKLCEQLKLLHIAGFDVTLRQYPGGDQVMGQPIYDFNTWMMEQMAAQPDSSIIL